MHTNRNSRVQIARRLLAASGKLGNASMPRDSISQAESAAASASRVAPTADTMSRNARQQKQTAPVDFTLTLIPEAKQSESFSAIVTNSVKNVVAIIDALDIKGSARVSLPTELTSLYPELQKYANSQAGVAEAELNLALLEDTAAILLKEIKYQAEVADLFYMPISANAKGLIAKNLAWIESDLAKLFALDYLQESRAKKAFPGLSLSETKQKYLNKTGKEASIQIDLEKYTKLSDIFVAKTADTQTVLSNVDKQWMGFVNNAAMATSSKKSSVTVVSYPWCLERLFGSSGKWLGAVSYDLRSKIQLDSAAKAELDSAKLSLDHFPHDLATGMILAIQECSGGADLSSDQIWPQLAPYVSTLERNPSLKSAIQAIINAGKIAAKGPWAVIEAIGESISNYVTATKYTVKEAELPPLGKLFSSAAFSEDIVFTLVQRYLLLKQADQDVKNDSAMAHGLRDYCLLTFGFVADNAVVSGELQQGSRRMLNIAASLIDGGLTDQLGSDVDRLSLVFSSVSALQKVPKDLSWTTIYKIISKSNANAKNLQLAKATAAQYSKGIPEPVLEAVKLKAMIEVSAKAAKGLSEIALSKAKAEQSFAEIVQELAKQHSEATAKKKELDLELANLLLEKFEAEIAGDYTKAAELSAMISAIRAKRTNLTLSRVNRQGIAATDAAAVGNSSNVTSAYTDTVARLTEVAGAKTTLTVEVQDDRGITVPLVVEIQASDSANKSVQEAGAKIEAAKVLSDAAKTTAGDAIKEINDNMNETGSSGIVPNQQDSATIVEDSLPKTQEDTKKGSGLSLLLLAAGAAVAAAGAVPVGAGLAGFGLWSAIQQSKKDAQNDQ